MLIEMEISLFSILAGYSIAIYVILILVVSVTFLLYISRKPILFIIQLDDEHIASYR